MVINSLVSPLLRSRFRLAMAVISRRTRPFSSSTASSTSSWRPAIPLRRLPLDPAAAHHRPLAALGAGEWDVPQLDSPAPPTVAGHADIEGYEMTSSGRARATAAWCSMPTSSTMATTRMSACLLAVSDQPTPAQREVKTLLREKAILLQSCSTASANSLQIIATSSCKAPAGPVGRNPHASLRRPQPVMSVAALQSQLAASRARRGRASSLFHRPCRTIAAS